MATKTSVKSNVDQGVLERPMTVDPNDLSGTPVALIESVRRSGRLQVLDRVYEDEVVIDFPMGEIPRQQTGCRRFVRVANGYALVRR